MNAIARPPDGSGIYIGGAFDELDRRSRALMPAAVDTSGKLLPWAPVLDSSVNSIAVAPDDSQVLLGGFFQHHQRGVAERRRRGRPGQRDDQPAVGCQHRSQQPRLQLVGQGHRDQRQHRLLRRGGQRRRLLRRRFRGQPAGSADSLLWQNDCLGATQALEVVNGFLFKGSHAHDCAYKPGGFPQVNAAGGSPGTCWTSRSPTARWGTGLRTPAGPSWRPRARGVMATDGSQLFVGGDFTTVNGAAAAGHRDLPDRARLVPRRPTRPPRRR